LYVSYSEKSRRETKLSNILKIIKNNLICVFKGHIVDEYTVNYLYLLKDSNEPKKFRCVCQRCNYPLLIYKIEKDSYEIIEDV
jgi:hypothetical protein